MINTTEVASKITEEALNLMTSEIHDAIFDELEPGVQDAQLWQRIRTHLEMTYPRMKFIVRDLLDTELEKQQHIRE